MKAYIFKKVAMLAGAASVMGLGFSAVPASASTHFNFSINAGDPNCEAPGVSLNIGDPGYVYEPGFVYGRGDRDDVRVRRDRDDRRFEQSRPEWNNHDRSGRQGQSGRSSSSRGGHDRH